MLFESVEDQHSLAPDIVPARVREVAQDSVVVDLVIGLLELSCDTPLESAQIPSSTSCTEQFLDIFISDSPDSSRVDELSEAQLGRRPPLTSRSA